MIEATKQAGSVVYPVSSTALLPGLLEHARGVGHMAALPDEDGVYRSVPVSLNLNGRPVPAFGVAIAAAFLQVPPDKMTVPVDAQGRMLINYAGRWAEGPFPYLSFVDVWDAVEEGRLEELRRLVSGKIVLLLQASLESDKRRTPLELKAPGGFIHANVINTILTGHTLSELPFFGRVLLTITLALVSAWLMLSAPGWKGLGFTACVAVVYAGLSQVLLVWDGLVFPMLAPLSALILASGGTMAWTTLHATGRIRHLEADVLAAQAELASTRESLARHESTVERLEEDLEAAQATAADSVEKKGEFQRYADGLRAQLDAAQAQAETSRQELRRLEAKLADLSAVTVKPVRLSDAQMEGLRQECEQFGIITQDPMVLGVFRDVKKAAQSMATVLLLGETGTGKELFARAVHVLSLRAGGPFVPINVAAIPKDLAESELFGHVRGAFTGAIRDHKGCFEQAHQGTIFLDEIGDLSLDLQAKLLRVLQEGFVTRVGDTRPTSVDVRVVAATNKDLNLAVAQGKFRQDLYYRLNVVQLQLPPLRERVDDIPLLADFFLRKAASRAGRKDLALSKKALEVLKQRSWNGNIRELENCIERACVMAEGTLITEQDLRFEEEKSGQAGVQGRSEPAPAPDVTGDAAVLTCLRRHGFDMQETAQALGWDRSSVTQRLKGLCFRALVDHAGDVHAAAALLAGDPSLVRIVELKMRGYYENLMEVAAQYGAVEEALAACRCRLKNLPDRHMPAVEALVRQCFDRPATLRGT